jgi:hypothetical protein
VFSGTCFDLSYLNKKLKVMKKQAVIKSVESKINIGEPALVSAITRFTREDKWQPKKTEGLLPDGYKTFIQSSAFTKISGNLDIAFVTAADEKLNHLSIPFNSWFLFTCIKENMEAYKIGWAVSLS